MLGSYCHLSAASKGWMNVAHAILSCMTFMSAIKTRRIFGCDMYSLSMWRFYSSLLLRAMCATDCLEIYSILLGWRIFMEQCC